MPFPFLFAGAAIISGIYGVSKTIEAKEVQEEAEEVNERAQDIVNAASRKIEKCRSNCASAIDNLGQRKIKVLNGSVKLFVEEFEKLHNVEMSDSQGLCELQKLVLDKDSLSNLKRLQSMAGSIAGGMTSGAAAGALTAFGAYSAVGLLGTTSAGVAIAGLGGAAATNATLAFLGGGSLAAGGLGVAGGTAILGGLVLGPALAVLGMVTGSEASANLDKAYSNLSKAKSFREDMNTACTACDGIRERADLFNRFLISLNSVFEPLIYDMAKAIKKNGTNFQKFSAEEKETVAEAMAMAGAVKSILDTPILDKSGKLTGESREVIAATRDKLGALLE